VKDIIVGLDHIGIVVRRIEDSISLYEQLLGMKLEKLEVSKKHGVKAAFLSIGETNIELVEPLSESSPVARFLEKRGQGVHHLAFRVENMEGMLENLKDKGVLLVDEKPRIGIEGGKIAFLHPKSTGDVLVELCEH
jgi:methylmalonyl-CoA/ethylmalonyl-CoA epimerase